MTLASDAILSESPLADTALYSSGSGSLPAFAGFGTQDEVEFRGEMFWATETQARFVARDSDGDEMLGVTDKAPEERVWYECEFADVLRGAAILSKTFAIVGSLNVLSSETVDGHLVRALVSGVGQGETAQLSFQVICSDGSIRKRSLKIRGKEL